MKFLIVSDIHGNREALEAVLKDARGQYDRIVCLGDIVGYGADPNFVVDWVRANVSAIVRGNHDAVCAGLESLSRFNDNAAEAAAWSRRVLSPKNLAYLKRLPAGPLPHEGFDLSVFDGGRRSHQPPDYYAAHLLRTHARPRRISDQAERQNQRDRSAFFTQAAVAGPPVQVPRESRLGRTTARQESGCGVCDLLTGRTQNRVPAGKI
jgi:hypothetical protein